MTQEQSIVAAVQWSPEVLNPTAGAEKAAAAVREAGAKGAGLVVFPECWLQGYPYWSGLAPSSPEYQHFRQLSFEASIPIDSTVLEPVYVAAREQGCTVVLGLQERVGGTYFAHCYLLARMAKKWAVSENLCQPRRSGWSGDGAMAQISMSIQHHWGDWVG